ncbi:hypothetical protein ACLUXY_08060 [Limosilactobacillus reuteri subsp. suis]|uniref:hypothetical protein n=1 Tax=Limosilactobacillus reuteri TaxID=1598 RepID=UPI003992AD50
MSKGNSKRIKRLMETLNQSKNQGNTKFSFNKGNFNNTQRFNDKKLTVQQYNNVLQLQRSDLVILRDNANFLRGLPEADKQGEQKSKSHTLQDDQIHSFEVKVKNWIKSIEDDSSQLPQVLKEVEQLVKQHSLSVNQFYILIYLFEACFQVGNSQAVTKRNTSESLKNWWSKYAVYRYTNGKLKQLVFVGKPDDVETVYEANSMQYELATKIIRNSCRVKIRDTNQLPSNTDLTSILKTDIANTYGVVPVCPAACPKNFVLNNPDDFINGLRYLLLFMSKLFSNLDTRGINNKVIHFIDLPVTEGITKTDTFYVALDCEYVSRQLTEDTAKDEAITKIRNIDDVLSFQLYAINAKGTETNGLIVHNTTHQHFTMSELVSAVQQVIEPLRLANIEDSSKRTAIVHLLTYYGGVDLSCFAGWERFWNNTNMIVLKKNAPFTTGYVTKKLNDGSKIRFDVTDLMNDAPLGGLKVLGDMVGAPKIDTEKDDVKDGLVCGYYKAHMDQYRNNRPKAFSTYAMNDSIITLKYALFLRQTLGKIPKTTGSYAASEVAKARQKYPEQFISDPEQSLSDYVRSVGSELVRYGQKDLYEESRKGLYGGHNCAYVSGYGFGRVIDLDLASAYNVGGHLLPVIDYSETDYPFIDSSQVNKYMIKGSDGRSSVNHSFRIKDCDFEDIGTTINNTSPFLIGVGEFKIDYPDNTVFIVTPSHSKDGSPIYVKHYEDWCPLIDAYNAWKHGASVKVITLRVPKQNQDGLNVFGDFQNKMIKLRNASKAKMEHSKKGSPQYVQAYGEQLLYKLIANSTYGKTLQGAGNKKSRDFDTYLMGKTPKSSVTDPFIGINYTGFTRYLVSILYDASKHCSVTATQLNITTDGLTLSIPSVANGKKFVSEMYDYYNSHMTDFYFDRLHLAGKKLGFELKANVVGHWFNLRTRVNGNLAYSKTGKGIFATASMMGQKSYNLFKNIKNDVISIKNKTNRISNLTEMKYRLQNHYGSQEQWEQITNVTLGYDFAYQPVSLLQGKEYCYFTTVPYENKDQHDNAKAVGGQLVKMVPMRTNQQFFNLFLKTMNESPTIKRKLTTLKDRSKYQDEFYKYCEHQYLYDLSINVLNGDLTNAINLFCNHWKASPSSVKRSIRRVKAGKTKVNYVAGLYFQEVLNNGSK